MSPGELFSLQGRAAVVTGAGSGLGREIAQVYAEAGASVLCADLDAVSAERTAALITACGGTALPVTCDVADPVQVTSMIRRAVAELGPHDDPRYVSALTGHTPMGRVADATEIRGPALFLASAASDYMTGQLLVVDGGCTAR